MEEKTLYRTLLEEVQEAFASPSSGERTRETKRRQFLNETGITPQEDAEASAILDQSDEIELFRVLRRAGASHSPALAGALDVQFYARLYSNLEQDANAGEKKLVRRHEQSLRVLLHDALRVKKSSRYAKLSAKDRRCFIDELLSDWEA